MLWSILQLIQTAALRMLSSKFKALADRRTGCACMKWSVFTTAFCSAHEQFFFRTWGCVHISSSSLF